MKATRMQFLKFIADSPIGLHVLLMANHSATERSNCWHRRTSLVRVIQSRQPITSNDGVQIPHQKNRLVETVRIVICSNFVVSNLVDETSRTTI